MHLDVVDLRNFYYRTRLGRVAQRAIRDHLRALWPDVKGQTVAGYGFAAPLLRPFLAPARRVIALMPAAQGVMPWPADMANVSVLCEEVQWPLATGMVDRLVVMHGFEQSEQPSALLEEAYRVLGPGGRVVFIVPARAGLWARGEGTPFGSGRPYTPGQIEAQLRRHDFTVENATTALFVPPSERQFWLRTAEFWEKTGRRFSPWFGGGVLMVEASKKVYASGRGGLRAAVRKPLRVLEGVGQAIPAPSLELERPDRKGG